jgi:acyl carrier protein
MSATPASDRESGEQPDEAIVDQLRDLFREALSIEVASPDTDLIDAGLLDSLALVELIFQIEQRFAIDLALEELEVDNFRTLTRLSTAIAEQANATE